MPHLTPVHYYSTSKTFTHWSKQPKHMHPGSVALHEAIARNNIQLATNLLKQGIPFDTANRKGETPLDCACALGDIGLIQLLLAQGAKQRLSESLEHKDDDLILQPPHIWLATQKGSLELVELLIQYGADCNGSHKGLTPLHLACIKNYKTIAQILIAQGADLNGVDGYGQTPLHKAVQRNHQELVSALLRAGARADVHDNNIHTPLDLAPAPYAQQLIALFTAEIPN
jgi:ankyrin repeat protein